MGNWKIITDDCEILLNVSKMEPISLLEMLNLIHPVIQSTVKVNENNLPFLEILIHKDGNKIWMGIYSKTIDSKRYLPFYLNHLKNCLNNISFGLVRRICTIIENSKITKNIQDVSKIFK